MDNSFHRKGSDTKPSGSFLAASVQIVDNILHWLADLAQLTEEEQKDAGIYLGDQVANTYQHSQDSDNKEQHHGQ